MPTVGYARVSSTGQDLAVQMEKLTGAGCERIFKEKRSGVDASRPELKRCLEYASRAHASAEARAYRHGFVQSPRFCPRAQGSRRSRG